MQAPGQAITSHDATPAEEYRNEARVKIKIGETASLVGGGGLQLIRLVLTDEGPLAQEDGSIIEQPEVICTMRPEEARRRAIELLHAAERAEHDHIETRHCGPAAASRRQPACSSTTCGRPTDQHR